MLKRGPLPLILILVLANMASAQDATGPSSSETAPGPVGAWHPEGDWITGIRVVTRFREVVGHLVRETPIAIEIKAARSATPIQVPHRGVTLRNIVKIRESVAYSADEMIDRRIKKAPANDVEASLAIAQFARSLGKYQRARKLLQRALAAAPDRSKEIGSLIEHNTVMAKEENALLIQNLQDKRKKQEELKRAILSREVPRAYRAKRSAMLYRLSASHLFQTARSGIRRIDTEAVRYCAKKFDITPDDVKALWNAREKMTRTAGYGDGSWIVKGGQEGGLDTGRKPSAGPGLQDLVLFPFYVIGAYKYPPTKTVTEGRILDTAQGWWNRASRSSRRQWLEAEYASISSNVNGVKRSSTEKCKGPCQGRGNHTTRRQGGSTVVTCSRCHGVKVDVTVTYW